MQMDGFARLHGWQWLYLLEGLPTIVALPLYWAIAMKLLHGIKTAAGQSTRIRKPASAEALGISFDQMKNEYLEKISLRRMVSGQDVAATAHFLASRAGRNVSAEAISVDENVEYL